MFDVFSLFQPNGDWNRSFLEQHPEYTWQLNCSYSHFLDPKYMQAMADNYNAILMHQDGCAWLRFKNEEDGIKARDDMKRFYKVIMPALVRAYMTSNEVKAAIEEITEPFTMMDEISK